MSVILDEASEVFEAIEEVREASAELRAAAATLQAENETLVAQIEQDAAIAEGVEQILAQNGEDLFARLQFATTVLASIVTYGGDDPSVPVTLAASAVAELGPFVTESATDGRFIADNAVVDAGVEAIVELGLVYDASEPLVDIFENLSDLTPE